MAPHRSTRFDAGHLIVLDPARGESRIPFYAGAMHYWRVPPARWLACLQQIRALGLTLVETYVPWRVHEPATAGAFDWAGGHDLRRFLDAAEAAGLHVVLRPGPHVNAELTHFGFPDHVLADPDVQARSAAGTPVWLPSPPHAWPVPSYASAKFHAHVRRWYAEVARVVDRHPAVVALGVDNEAQLFFRAATFDHDYHPDALAWFGGEAPRDASDPARAIAWAKFKPAYLARALGVFAQLLDDTSLAGLARFHNLPPGHFGLSSPGAIAAAIGGPVGIDAYTPRHDFAALRHRALACVGANAASIPLAPEVGIGFFPWFPPLDQGGDVHRERDQLLTLLAAGIRGFNLFMAVERDRYYGAAIDARGTQAKHAPWIAKLTAALGEVDWPNLRRRAAIALVDTRADARFGDITNTLEPVTPVLVEALGSAAAELGTDAGAIAARKWQRAIIRALELAQVPFVIVEETADLAPYAAVIVPTLARVDRALWTRLAAHKAIVVIGPGTPVRDEFDRPLDAPGPRRAGKIRDGSLDDLPGLADDLSHLVAHGDAWQIERPDQVRAAAFADAQDRVRCVFVYSDSEQPATATLFADATLVDVFTSETLAPKAGRVAVALPARGIRMFAVRA